MCFLFWLAFQSVLSQDLTFERAYLYSNNKSLQSLTKVSIQDSIKVFTYTNHWQPVLSYKIEKLQTYGDRELIFFSNESGSHLIGELDYKNQSFLIRTDTKYHPKKLIVLYYIMYYSG